MQRLFPLRWEAGTVKRYSDDPLTDRLARILLGVTHSATLALVVAAGANIAAIWLGLR